MKLQNFLAPVLALAFALAPLTSHAENVSIAKAAELSCHRIERLVILKKIDSDYLNKLYALEVSPVELADQPSAKFRVVATQIPLKEGAANQMQLIMDASGKTLKTEDLKTGNTPSQAPVWADKDPVTLIENSLHYVLDNGPVNANVKPFLVSLKKVVLYQTKDAAGATLAKVVMENAENNNKLEVLLKQSGELISGNVVN